MSKITMYKVLKDNQIYVKNESVSIKKMLSVGDLIGLNADDDDVKIHILKGNIAEHKTSGNNRLEKYFKLKDFNGHSYEALVLQSVNCVAIEATGQTSPSMSRVITVQDFFHKLNNGEFTIV